jgi:hypothetical protein
MKAESNSNDNSVKSENKGRYGYLAVFFPDGNHMTVVRKIYEKAAIDFGYLERGRESHIEMQGVVELLSCDDSDGRKIWKVNIQPGDDEKFKVIQILCLQQFHPTFEGRPCVIRDILTPCPRGNRITIGHGAGIISKVTQLQVMVNSNNNVGGGRRKIGDLLPKYDLGWHIEESHDASYATGMNLAYVKFMWKPYPEQKEKWKLT